MTAILDRVPVDKITAEAREVHFGRAVLTVVAALLYGIGWVTAKVVGGVWFALAWAWTAVKVGWTEARASRAAGRGVTT
jgi:hypothetical protein